MKRLELLDYGRFMAAIAVLIYHYFFDGISNGKISSIDHIPGFVEFAKYGYLGVEFFFMISGYVIFFSARNRTPREFAIARAVRLYPAFWFAVIFTTVFAQFWGGTEMSVTIQQALANLTMIPESLGYGYVDGVYWTLNLELRFYLGVFFCLIIGWQSKLDFIFLLWPWVMLLALFLGQQHIPYLGDYYSYFAAGSIFAILKDRPSKVGIASLLISFYLCMNFSTKNAFVAPNSQEVGSFNWVVTVVILVHFLVFCFLNSKTGSSLTLPGSKLAGSLTYPLYLIHSHFSYMIISQFSTNENKLFIYVVTFVLVLLVSYFIHVFVEKKLAKLSYRIFSYTVGTLVDILNHILTSARTVYNHSIKKIP